MRTVISIQPGRSPHFAMHSFRRQLRLLIFLVCLSFTLPSAALAQTSAPAVAPAPLPPEAQDALKKGILAAQQQEWDIAIQSFQDARRSAPDAPVLFYNLGLAESKIPGRELRAIAWFGAYLAAAPNAPNAAAVNDAIVGLQIKSEGNIERMVNVVQEADGLIPDAPITHDNGITNFTNKPDIDRVMALYKVAVLWADAGNSAKAIDLAHRIGAAGYNQSDSLSEIVVAQAGSGHLADAIKTAASWYDVNDSETAQLAIAAAQAKDGDSAAARATLTAAQSTAAGVQSAYMRNSQLGQIARAQTDIGDIPGAQKTAGLIPSPEAQSLAEIDIAKAQVHAGDPAGAQASLLLAQQGVDRWASLTDAQKIVACECTLDPHENLADVEVLIADARRLAAARANSSPPAAPQPESTPSHQQVPPSSPAVSLADWTGELDRLNAPIFLDLSEALKTPQATYKTIYPGSSGFDDSNGDPKKMFEALVAIAKLEISEKNTIDHMLKQQARE
jgi:tetratricopeptide (TPR) repeat protein